MPHFGLMDESGMPIHEAELLRARLHLRGGKRRLREGKLRSGLATVYDALYSAMRSYATAPANHSRFEGTDIGEAGGLYEALVAAGVLDGRFEFLKFKELVEKTIDEEIPVYDHKYAADWLIIGVEGVMTQLGALPFDETSLPKEDPEVF